MRLFNKKEWVIAGATGVVVLVGAQMGLAERFGAHPSWGLKIGLSGILAGMLLELFMVQEKGWFLAKAVVILAFLAVATMVATIAKAQFAVTYGEDGLAGLMWYLGSTGMAAGAFLAVFLILSLFVRPGTR